MAATHAQHVTVGGRYRSLFVVGRGGMGSVEAALELETPEGSPRSSKNGANGREFERIVALKRLLPDAARDRRRVEMFLREAKVAAMLDHPNVVTAYDYGEADGELYLAMEYVEGQPLSRVLKVLAEKGETLPVAMVAYLLAEVCHGLHAAHQLADPTTGQTLNLVHRDVSPQNVMLGYDGRVRLLDFGVAKIEAENVTKTGEVKGKSAYMSPEQAMGDPLDRRSDLFGVGALLFECLALRRMWGDGTDMEVIRKLALESPPSLEDTKRSGLSAELVALHAKLVARAPSDRPATAADVAHALDALVNDKEAAARGLRTLLEGHFAAEAADQRARLTASLHDVAPAQADALRESMLPSSTRPSRESVPKAEPAPAKSTNRFLRVGATLAIIALVVWIVRAVSATGPAADRDRDPVRPEPSAIATSASGALPKPLESASPAPAALVSDGAAPIAPTRSAPASPPVVRPLPRPTPSTKSSAVTPPPTPSMKPLEVDEHPF